MSNRPDMISIDEDGIHNRVIIKCVIGAPDKTDATIKTYNTNIPPKKAWTSLSYTFTK